MNTEGLTLQRLLALRKLTRGISELFRGQLREHLTTLAPVIRPKAVFGDYVQGGAKEAARGADRAYAELREAYQKIAPARPFGVIKELVSPFEIEGATPELAPMEYSYAVGSKNVVVTTPLRWVLAYGGYAPSRLKEVLATRNPPADVVQRFLVHYLAVNAALAKQAGVARLFEALRYSICTVKLAEFGELPVTTLAAPVATVRPPDEVILESTELSGKDVFEEVVDLEQIRALRDPLREQLATLAAGYGEAV